MKSIGNKFIVFVFLGFVMSSCSNNSGVLQAPFINEQDVIGKNKYDLWKIITRIEKTDRPKVRATGKSASMLVDPLHQGESVLVPEYFMLAQSWHWHGGYHIYRFDFNKHGVVTSMGITALP